MTSPHSLEENDFDRHAEGYAPGMSSRIKRLAGGTFQAYIDLKANVFLKHINSPNGLNGKKLLDFGAGTGELMRRLIANGCRANMVGCDLSIKMLQKGVSAVTPEIVYIQSTTPPAPFADDTFDYITASCVFHHINCSEIGRAHV